MVAKKPTIVVIGGSYVDLAIRCSQVPATGENISGSSLSLTVIGPGPTQAVAGRLCGADVYLISKVGDDPFGEMVKKNLAEFNIHTDFVYPLPAKNTGMVVTLVNATGENTTITYMGANSALTAGDIDSAEQIISNADVCLIHGALPQDAITRAITTAKLHAVKVILNPARPVEPSRLTPTQMERSANHERGRQAGPALPVEYFSADILIPNLYEAADITDTDKGAVNIRTAKLIGSDLVARGVKSAVITMGRRGAMVVDRNGASHIPAYQVELVDASGAGDAFAGALAAAYAVADDVMEAVKFASAAGALVCTKFGCIEALPTKAEIIELMQKEDIG